MSLNAMAERDVRQREPSAHAAITYTVPATQSGWLDSLLQQRGMQITPVDHGAPTVTPSAPTVTKAVDTREEASAIGKALRAITDYIPSEMVLIFTCLGTTYDTRWGVAPQTLELAGVTLSVLMVYGLSVAKGVQRQLVRPWRPTALTVYNSVAAGVAFWAWLNALPYFQTEVRPEDGVILVIVTAILGIIGQMLGPK